jgi:dTDP-4-dehydrorhamnose 3,5-epimerase-like enzyme
MRHLETVRPALHEDSRGTITTFLPDEPIVEYNVVTIRAGCVRGMHWHPEFTEYLLFVVGHGILRYRDIDSPEVETMYVGPGVSTRAVPGLAHAIEATTDMTFIAMLTRRWDDCDPPIIRCDL